MIDFLLGVPGKLSTIYTYLTTHLGSTRAAKIDNLDATVSSRAAASTALSSATWTNTKAGYIDAAITGRLGSIKAIYRGTIALSGTSSSATATITAVVTEKSVIMLLGANHSGGVDRDAQVIARIELTNSTTVTAYHGSGSPGTSITVGYQVIEFN
jgi:hypothetical protein